MNKERRKQITAVINELETLLAEIERIQFDEQEAMENADSNLEEAYRSIEKVIDLLNEAAN